MKIKMKIRKHSMNVSRIVCKAIVMMIVLEGLGGPGTLWMAQVDGASSNRQSQQSSSNMNSFDTFGSGSGGREMKRMRDRCGRYSLLRVLQQWENLQKRCRLGVRDNSNKERDRYELISGSPPSLSAIDDITIEKRNDFFPGGGTGNNRHRNYYYEVNGDALESCCPVTFEVIAPIYGRNRSGHMVELYKDEHVQQKFYEYRCHKDNLEEPCRFVDSPYRKISKCVQQYLDTYALVKSDTSLTGWSMEHIRVASGCACKVDGVKAARRRKKVSSSNPLRNNFFLSGDGDGTGRNNRKQQQQMFQTSIIDY